MAKKQFTMERNLEKIIKKVEDKPERVMNEVGMALVKEIRPKINTKSKDSRKKFLQATLQYWYRRKEKDLIIGYKDPMKIGFLRNIPEVRDYKWLYDSVDDPLKPTVVKNVDNIQKLLGAAMDEINKE